MLASLAAPAPALQFSESHKFIESVKKRKGGDVEAMLAAPGSGVIHARDGNGNGVLHILARDRDYTWTSFMLGKGARPDTPDANGNTPLAIASQLGWLEGAQLLVSQGASVNAANKRGETPLILAVHGRHLTLVRLLLAAGANPRHTDSAAGYSAIDYARRDPRAAVILRLLEAPAAKTPEKIGPVL